MNATTTKAFDPSAREAATPHDLPIVKIDPRQIPPLEGKLIGRTFYEAMQRFYADPKNCRRFEEWQNERKQNAYEKSF